MISQYNDWHHGHFKDHHFSPVAVSSNDMGIRLANAASWRSSCWPSSTACSAHNSMHICCTQSFVKFYVPCTTSFILTSVVSCCTIPLCYTSILLLQRTHSLPGEQSILGMAAETPAENTFIARWTVNIGDGSWDSCREHIHCQVNSQYWGGWQLRLLQRTHSLPGEQSILGGMAAEPEKGNLQSSWVTLCLFCSNVYQCLHMLISLFFLQKNLRSLGECGICTHTSFMRVCHREQIQLYYCWCEGGWSWNGELVARTWWWGDREGRTKFTKLWLPMT